MINIMSPLSKQKITLEIDYLTGVYTIMDMSNSSVIQGYVIECSYKMPPTHRYKNVVTYPDAASAGTTVVKTVCTNLLETERWDNAGSPSSGKLFEFKKEYIKDIKRIENQSQERIEL